MLIFVEDKSFPALKGGAIQKCGEIQKELGQFIKEGLSKWESFSKGGEIQKSKGFWKEEQFQMQEFALPPDLSGGLKAINNSGFSPLSLHFLPTFAQNKKPPWK